MSSVRRAPLVASAFVAGLLAFESATAFTPDSSRTFLWEVFEGFASSYTDRFLGEKFLYARLHLVYGLAALLHGLLLALLVFIAMLFVAKLGRRGELLILVLFVVIDLAFLVFLFPDPLGAHYEHWVFGG